MKWIAIFLLLMLFFSPVSAGSKCASCTGSTGGNVTATIDVNWTFTGAPGTAALVTNIGTIYAGDFDFIIPAGFNGTPGAPGNSSTVSVNATFTLPPGSLATVTNVGTPFDVELDYGIPEGMMNQTPNMTPASFIGSTWYDHNEASSDLPGYKIFNRTLPHATEGSSSVVASAPTTEFLIQSFATELGDPQLSALTAGTRIWYTYANVDSIAGGATMIKIRFFKRSSVGVETELYNMTTGSLTTTTAVYTTSVVTSSDIPLATTDRFVVKYYAVTASASNPTVTLYYDGTTHASYATSPIVQGPPGPAGTSAYVYGNQSEVLYNIGGNATTSPCMRFDNVTGGFYACTVSGDGFNLTNITSSNANRLLMQVKEGGVSALKKGMAVYVSGGTIGLPYVRNASNTNASTSRVIGLVYADMNINAAGNVVRYGTLENVDTRSTNTAINPNGETWAAGDLLFLADSVGGGMTKVRPTSGRSVKVAYALSPSSAAGSLLAYPLENPVWVTAAANEGIVLRLGDNDGLTNISIRNYTNKQVASINSLGNLVYNGSSSSTDLSAYQTIANDSAWDKGYSINVMFLTGTWSNGTTYYFGNIPAAVTTIAGQRRIYISKAGNITGAEVWIQSGTAGSDQPWAIDIVKNGGLGNSTTLGNVTTVGTPLSRKWSANTSFRLRVERGDYIEMKTYFGLFPVKPATSIGGGYVYIE